MRRLKKVVLYSFVTLIVLMVGGVIYFYFRTKIDPPVPASTEVLKLKVNQIDSTTFVLGKNWLKKNEGGLWEMYVEGDAFERGVVIGKLAQPLIRKQEQAFIGQIRKIIPSDSYLKFLKYFIAWFNRDLDEYIPEEYKFEIYGESFAASDEFNFVGPPYHRMLNYHAAHDIGHALQDKNMVVGCTSFSVWGQRTTDSSLIVGRNFDFYSGDEFAEDKIVAFFNPDKGNRFMIVTWGGMIGAVSGMNEDGLSVTINAGKSDMPTGSATPISILAREILQYASNISEAYEIAKKRKTFVAEALMIGSATEGKTAVIEKSPTKIDILYPEDNQIVCSNHFQSKGFETEETNLKNISESASFYRFQRVKELLNKNPQLDYRSVARILRDQKGQNEQDIGIGNELALNQMIAHHSIIFKPKEKIVWVSSNPFQLGAYYAYDLNTAFQTPVNKKLSIDSLRIGEDLFLSSEGYKKFILFKSLKTRINEFLQGNDSKRLTGLELETFEESNPEYYHTYSLLGDYFKKTGDLARAKEYYKKGLTKEVATMKEKRHMQENLNNVE